MNSKSDRIYYICELFFLVLPVTLCLVGLFVEIYIDNHFIRKLISAIEGFVESGGHRQDDLLKCLLFLIMLGATCAMLWQLAQLSIQFLARRAAEREQWRRRINRCLTLVIAVQSIIFVSSIAWGESYDVVIGLFVSLLYLVFWIPPLHLRAALKAGRMQLADDCHT